MATENDNQFRPQESVNKPSKSEKELSSDMNSPVETKNERDMRAEDKQATFQLNQKDTNEWQRDFQSKRDKDPSALGSMPFVRLTGCSGASGDGGVSTPGQRQEKAAEQPYLVVDGVPYTRKEAVARHQEIANNYDNRSISDNEFLIAYDKQVLAEQQQAHGAASKQYQHKEQHPDLRGGVEEIARRTGESSQHTPETTQSKEDIRVKDALKHIAPGCQYDLKAGIAYTTDNEGNIVIKGLIDRKGSGRMMSHSYSEIGSTRWCDNTFSIPESFLQEHIGNNANKKIKVDMPTYPFKPDHNPDYTKPSNGHVSGEISFVDRFGTGGYEIQIKVSTPGLPPIFPRGQLDPKDPK